MSYRVNKKIVKGDVNVTNCHVCEKNGESAQVCGTHNFRDMKGRVVCDRFLKKMRDNHCYKCKGFGHFPDKCNGISKPKSDISSDIKACIKLLDRRLNHEEVKAAFKQKVKSESKTSQNAFAAFASSSDDEEDDDKSPANVTLRKPVVKAKPKSWADYESDEEF